MKHDYPNRRNQGKTVVAGWISEDNLPRPMAERKEKKGMGNFFLFQGVSMSR